MMTFLRFALVLIYAGAALKTGANFLAGELPSGAMTLGTMFAFLAIAWDFFTGRLLSPPPTSKGRNDV